MPKTKSQKQQVVSDLAKKIEGNKSFFVVAPNGINPNESAKLKMKLSEVDGEYHLVKNSLFVLALEQLGFEVPASFKTSQNAVIFANDKAPEAAKILKEFIKDTEKAEFKEGFLEGKVMSAAQVGQLAELPSREVMLAQVLATMNAPVSGFVNVLAGNVRSIVTVIDAIRQAKQEQGA
jgi:large subunit ribosomal protein L10